METTAFGQLTVRFDERVLRPRPWTLAQSIWAAETTQDLPDGPILEVCAGVGHIGLVLASLVPRDLVLVDASGAACEHARHNADGAGLSDRVEVRHGRMDAVLDADERFALVLADPPWVVSDETAHFPDDPRSAIDGGADGLELARICAAVADRHLLPGGASILQLGTVEQAEQLRDEIGARPSLALRVDQIRSVPTWNGVLVRLLSTRLAEVEDADRVAS